MTCQLWIRSSARTFQFIASICIVLCVAESAYASRDKCSAHGIIPPAAVCEDCPRPLFGMGLSLSDDHLLVGAPRWEKPDGPGLAGAVFVFRKDGPDRWASKGELLPDGEPPESLASFGRDIASNGELVCIGSDGARIEGVSLGAVYVFETPSDAGGRWRQLCKVVSSAGIGQGSLPLVGWSVDLDNVTEQIVAGAVNDDGVAVDSGSAFVFEREGDDWTQMARVVAPDGESFAEFGHRVGLHKGLLVVGAYRDGSEDRGAVYIYRPSDSRAAWEFSQKLVSPNYAQSDRFGIDLSVNAGAVAIGSYDALRGPDSGSVYIYRDNGVQLVLDRTIVPFDNETGDLAVNVELTDSHLLVGALDANEGSQEPGIAYVYERRGQDFFLTERIAPPAPERAEAFGIRFSVSPAGDEVAIADSIYMGDEQSLQQTGAVFILGDENGDGSFGGCAPVCPQDINRNGAVDSTDIGILLGSWGPDQISPSDFNNDNRVDSTDLAYLLGSWGACP